MTDVVISAEEKTVMLLMDKLDDSVERIKELRSQLARAEGVLNDLNFYSCSACEENLKLVSAYFKDAHKENEK